MYCAHKLYLALNLLTLSNETTSVIPIKGAGNGRAGHKLCFTMKWAEPQLATKQETAELQRMDDHPNPLVWTLEVV